MQQENKNTAMSTVKSNAASCLKSVLLMKKNSEEKNSGKEESLSEQQRYSTRKEQR
jgi:hypothetical protein